MNLRSLAERFCATPLPESVCADPCASMQGYPNRTGTNLLTVVEAWKYYHANATDSATGAVVAPGSAMNGQPSPTLNS